MTLFYMRILIIPIKWKRCPCDLLEELFLKQPFDALKNQIFNSFNEFKDLLDTFSIEW